MRKLILAMGLTGCLSATAWAVPQVLNFQGRLVESGLPVSGSRSMLFKIYDAPSGGAQLFSESRTVSVSTGIFNVLIGETTSGGIPLSVFNGSDRYVEVQVGSQTLPRQRVVSVGYAFMSETAAFATQASTAAFAQRAAVADTLAGGIPVSVTTITATTVNVTTITVTNIVATSGTVSGFLKVGKNTIILGETPLTGGLPNTVAFTGGDAFIKTQDPSSGNLTLEAGANKDILLSGGGKVGVGVAVPETKLHVDGSVTAGRASAVTGGVKLYNSASAHATTIQAGNAMAAVVYKLPINDGAPGQILSTDGNGQLSWVNAVPFPGPTLASVSPTGGSAAGGTTITLLGSNFRTGATVRVGGNLATGIVFVSQGDIRAVTPPGAPGLQDIVIQNPDGQTATLIGAFNYLIANGCSDGVVDQVFTNNSMVACNGSVPHSSAASLCGSGWHLCSLQEYGARRNGINPNDFRWLQRPSDGVFSWSQNNIGTLSCVVGNPASGQAPTTTTRNPNQLNFCHTQLICGGTGIPECAIHTTSTLQGATCCF